MEDPRSWILFKLSFTFFLLQPDSDFTQTTKGKKQFQKCFFSCKSLPFVWFSNGNPNKDFGLLSFPGSREKAEERIVFS